MKQTVIPVFIALVLFPGILRAQDMEIVDRIVAVIGNDIITDAELEIQLLQARAQQQIDIDDESVRTQILDAMIENKLIFAQAELDSVEVSREEIQQALDEHVKRLVRHYGSEERLAQAAGMSTITQVKREFREDVRKRLLTDRIKQMKFSGVTVSHREIVSFYESYKDSLPELGEQVELQQISIFPKVVESFKTTALAEAQGLLDSLKAGADFGDLARRHSDDPGSVKNGGDLGLARRGVFVKEFEEAAFALEPGQVSGVVETQFGFHIIKLLEKKGEAIHPQHILLRVEKTGESDETALEELEALKKRAEDGEDFGELAIEHSEDVETAKFGGDMGLIELAELSEELGATVKGLEPGQISDPEKVTFAADYSFAIFKLIRRVPPHVPTLENDYQRLSLFAKGFKQQRMYREWIEEIKSNVYWKVNI